MFSIVKKYVDIFLYFNLCSTPSFAALSSQNSAAIPACFVLRLNKPMPMCVALVRQIQQLTEIECADLSTTHTLLSLIATHASEGKLDSTSMKGLFVVSENYFHILLHMLLLY